MLTTQVKSKKEFQLHVKLSDSQRQAIQENADRYAEGNISEWLRFAAMNHKPAKHHLVPPTRAKKK